MIVLAAVHKAEKGYWAEIPALGGCFTQGTTLAELRLNIVEALESFLWLSPKEKSTLKNLT